MPFEKLTPEQQALVLAEMAIFRPTVMSVAQTLRATSAFLEVFAAGRCDVDDLGTDDAGADLREAQQPRGVREDLRAGERVMFIPLSASRFPVISVYFGGGGGGFVKYEDCKTDYKKVSGIVTGAVFNNNESNGMSISGMPSNDCDKETDPGVRSACRLGNV